MNDYTVPPDPSMPPSAVPPPPPPPKKATPWGKIALFGGIGCFVLLLIVAGILVVFYLIGRDQVETYGTTDGGGEVSDLSDGGTSVHSGRLEAGDALAPDGSWYDEYPVSLTSGGRLVVTMESNDFDAYLTIMAPSGATTSDDDGGGGTNSRVERTIDESGTWRVRANSLRAGQTGNYSVTVSTTP